MMSSAQRELAVEEEAGEAAEFRLVAPAAAELKAEVAARLAEHRRRRGEGSGVVRPTSQRRDVGHPSGPPRQNAVAAAVAERYARTPSYRTVLAEQARRAAEEAAARAEVAQRHAVAAAAVQEELLGELELWYAPQEFSQETAEILEVARPTSQKRDEGHPASAGVLTVRLYEDLGAPVSRDAMRRMESRAVPDAEEQQALEAEIAFRKAPVFEEQQAPWEDTGGEAAEALPANLLEFPRQLVATRKARPRLAEGPLREEAPRSNQLRIFEVEPEQISTTPETSRAPEWTMSIRLDAHTPGVAVLTEGMAVARTALPPQTAPLELRAMAGLVDGGLVLGALVAFVAVFAKVAGGVTVGVPAGVAMACVGVALAVLYQALFFTLSEQTPGMRYAKIGLCTLDDENPTRAAMRRRILAGVFALCPLGLGVVWALLDEDGLGWHDRLSRMYQRAY